MFFITNGFQHFQNLPSLKKHMQTQTGERTCSCEVYGSVFSDKPTIKRHL